MANTCVESLETMQKLNETEEMNDAETGNQGWADVMDKILKTGTGPKDVDKKKRKRKTLILAKAKTDSEISAKLNRKVEDFEIAKNADEGEDEMEDDTKSKTIKKTLQDKEMTLKEMKKKFKDRKLQKDDWENRSRKKPDVTQRHKERTLQRIATKGVVQLFNAIRQRQVTIDTKFQESGQSEVRKEKVLKTMTKQDFLDKLKTSSKSLTKEESEKLKTIKKEKVTESEESKPTWDILRDDYMMGSQMKDWDKQSESEEEETY